VNRLALQVEVLVATAPELEVELRRVNKRLLGMMRRLTRVEKAIGTILERGCDECEWDCATRGSGDEQGSSKTFC
jgi:hypothetical protein